MQNLKVFVDGASRGNPGSAAVGVYITDEMGTVMYQTGECIGVCTNNDAEYQALTIGLKAAARLSRGNVSCFSDSQLAVYQLSGAFRIKNEKMMARFQEVKDMERSFKNVTYTHLPRENKYLRICDRLANEALNNAVIPIECIQ